MPGLFLNGGVPLGTLGLAVRKGEELRRACHWGSGGTEAPFIKGSPYKCLERLRIGEQKKGCNHKWLHPKNMSENDYTTKASISISTRSDNLLKYLKLYQNLC